MKSSKKFRAALDRAAILCEDGRIEGALEELCRAAAHLARMIIRGESDGDAEFEALRDAIWRTR